MRGGGGMQTAQCQHQSNKGEVKVVYANKIVGIKIQTVSPLTGIYLDFNREGVCIGNSQGIG